MAAGGNGQVIEMLEALLADARQGQAVFIIATILRADGTRTGGKAGDARMQLACMRALEQMAGEIEAEWVNCSAPKDRLPPNHAICNLSHGAAGFDFLVWLVGREMIRLQAGAPAPLKVRFWRGRDGKVGFQNPAHEVLIDRIFRPCLRMIGAVEDVTIAPGVGERDNIWTASLIGDLYRAGIPVPRPSASPSAKLAAAAYIGPDLRPIVTITLREAEHWPERNSNIKAWARFARYLEDRGQGVIVVRDTAKAEEHFFDFETCPKASKNLQFRQALYERASVNLFVDNGPAALALFGTRPFLTFVRQFEDGHPFHASTPSTWLKHQGFPAGGQYPWSAPDQRLVWATDDYENLVKAWENLDLLARAA